MSGYEEKLKKSVETAKTKIEALRAEDSAVFCIFTDLHTKDNNSESAKKLISALEMVRKEIKPDAVVDMGDNFDMLGRREYIENDELKRRMNVLFSDIYKAAGCPVVHVHGNHDGIGTDFFKADFWNDAVKGKYANTSAVYGDEGAYYYFECEKSDTRYVVLSLPHGSDLECENPTPLWSFGESQIKWLRDVALKGAKDVIILCHVPLYYKYMGDTEAMLETWNGKKATMSYISALCGWIDDIGEASEIINDFNKKDGCRVVACFSGHTHIDALWLPYEERGEHTNPLPCCQVITARAYNEECGAEDTGICIDAVVWTPSENKLNIIRIGDGEDREIII